jgi:hypothetical protein
MKSNKKGGGEISQISSSEFLLTSKLSYSYEMKKNGIDRASEIAVRQPNRRKD